MLERCARPEQRKFYSMPKTSEVFGVSPHVSDYSYCDRSGLDGKLKKLLSRDNAHIAIKGPSKCGKSWLRQKILPDYILIQCNPGMDVYDIYSQALSKLRIPVNIQMSSTTNVTAEISGQGELSLPLFGKAEAGASGAVEYSRGLTSSLDHATSTKNLEFIARSIVESKKRLVIEDFHYLSKETQATLAFHLKSLWDYHCNVIIIGVWSQKNLLTHMNGDLTGRIEEISVSWTNEELRQVLRMGSKALNVCIDPSIEDRIVSDSFGNVGILQSLMLRLVGDQAEIEETQQFKTPITNHLYYEKAAKEYAFQLDGLYQQFAKRLSSGIRRRKKSTGIYALSMEAIVQATDEQLIDGFSRDAIFNIIHKRESRIQKWNLKVVLMKLVEIQENNEKASKGNLVISYDEQKDSVFAVDLQLLFYRKHHTTRWPWEEIVSEAKQKSLFEEDDEDDDV